MKLSNMGGALSKLPNVFESISRFRLHGRKRPLDHGSDDEYDLERSLHVPKRKKLATTTQYIYRTLFEEGKDSDVTVTILSQDWKLHKIYLCQSPYFNSMFSGSWSETNQPHISIEVVDPFISKEALTIVLGSFYLDEVVIEPCEVSGVLAAASLFQLEGLIEQCAQIMMENISPLTAVQFYQAASRYALEKVKMETLQWFRINLIISYFKNEKRLREISPDLMLDIVKMHNLCVVQTETFLYLLVRKWIFLRCNPDFENFRDSKPSIEHYFRKDKTEPFLVTDNGSEFMEIFSHIRLGQVLLHPRDFGIVRLDNIVPESWLLSALSDLWMFLLKAVNGMDKGPTQVAEDYFNKNCLRLARTVAKNDMFSWRWNGFAFGLDLIWSLVENNLYVKRQNHSSNHNPSPRNVILRVEIFNLNEKGQVIRRADSGIVAKQLGKNVEVRVMSVTTEFQLPCLISVSLLFSSPPSDDSEQGG